MNGKQLYELILQSINKLANLKNIVTQNVAIYKNFFVNFVAVKETVIDWPFT